MSFNANLCDVEKYWLRWLRVLGCVERTWVGILCIQLCDYFCWYCFIVCLIVLGGWEFIDV